ncbi:FRG domain-containing protein [Desulfolutivibrio sulfoxidireducens]|uniref:FRG domain-containing protein n=1 Tax=Desulfolutivibrio sulfoxidireducens TaxID=2773299 RepID=UPI00159E469C|nr:FRG domain-containing protein [Desulfolutivibrio sulfoxidireducens]QLA17287.1 FRG domain-containing protein [Desulfolutivibrio sulfoxidireducens]
MRHPELSLDDFKAMDGISRWNERHSCFDIATPHALSQIAGYVKYKLSAYGPVYFRGQTKKHESMAPSLFRNVKTSGSCQDRLKTLKLFVKSAAEDKCFLNNTPEYAYEPLLQHYGIRTHWLDIVDNVWSALWFSCHEAILSGVAGQFVNFERNCDDFSYIFMMQFGIFTNQENPGVCRTDSGMRVVDLRISAPSTYLRPHSQHGLLASRVNNERSVNYNDCVVLVLRIFSFHAMEWLGRSVLVQDHFMFPPPKYDQGYKLFVEKDMHPHEILGRISFIGA